MILQIGPKKGRLAVVQKRPHEQLYLIHNLARVNKIKLGFNWKKFHAGLKQFDSYRNRVAHCVWVHHPGSDTPVIQDFSAAYISNLQEGFQPKITPIAVEVPLSHLRDIKSNGEQLLGYLEALENQIQAQLPSLP